MQQTPRMSRGSGAGRHKLACVGRTARHTSALRLMPGATAGTNGGAAFAFAVFGAARPPEPPPSLNLPILARRRRAKGGPIDCPVQSANQASATHNVAERDGNEIMDDASCRN